MQPESGDEEDDDQPEADKPYRRRMYNPNTDPENVSMHAHGNTDDVFTAGTQILVHATPNEGTASTAGGQARAPQTADNSDDEQEARRQNTRTISFASRSLMRPLTLIQVGTLDEEKNRNVFGSGENPHGYIEKPEAVYTDDQMLILQHCSTNEGHFIRALFYPSYIFQGVTPDWVELYCHPRSKFLAFVFFNGGNALHTKHKSTVTDLRDFLLRIGCKADDIQINAPFYQRPKVEDDGDNNQKKLTASGSSRSKPSPKRLLGGLSPVGHPKENDKYKGPNTAFVRIGSANIRSALVHLQTIAVSKTLTFHVITPSTAYRPWIVCTMFANTLTTSDHNRVGIRWAIMKAVRDDPTLINRITELG
ncbi:hypothetical protein C8R42DRAFT_724481 [Lentinula raphanica]|nr:hypothetical protein C8R42DRAFT_724481 [Lentinula raphanica]